MTKLRSRLARLFLLWFTLAGCHGPTPRPDARASEVARAQADTPGLFLYEVRGKGGSAHLLGTIHLGFSFEEVLTPSARARFTESQRVITEADVRAADPRRLLQAALLGPDQSLRQILGESTFAALAEKLGGQLPPALLERLEPWFPGVMLGLGQLVEVLNQLKPGAQDRQMDVELMAKADQLKKPLGFLETVDEQVAIFDTISLDEQARDLKRTLDESSEPQARAMIEGFRTGDERALAAAIFDPEQLAAAPGFFERILFARNDRWLPRIEREIAQGGAFIAVGAGHLLGERGLLRALEKRGYQVTRVGE